MKSRNRLLGVNLSLFLALSVFGLSTANAQNQSTEQMKKTLACDELAALDEEFLVNKVIMSAHKGLTKNKIQSSGMELANIIKEYNKESMTIYAQSDDAKQKAIDLIKKTNTKVVNLSAKMEFKSASKAFDVTNTKQRMFSELMSKSGEMGAEDTLMGLDWSKYMVDMKLSKAQSLELSLSRLFSEDERIIRKVEQSSDKVSAHLNEYAYALSLVANVMEKEDQYLRSEKWAAEFSRETSDEIRKQCPDSY